MRDTNKYAFILGLMLACIATTAHAQQSMVNTCLQLADATYTTAMAGCNTMSEPVAAQTCRDWANSTYTFNKNQCYAYTAPTPTPGGAGGSAGGAAPGGGGGASGGGASGGSYSSFDGGSGGSGGSSASSSGFSPWDLCMQLAEASYVTAVNICQSFTEPFAYQACMGQAEAARNMNISMCSGLEGSPQPIVIKITIPIKIRIGPIIRRHPVYRYHIRTTPPPSQSPLPLNLPPGVTI